MLILALVAAFLGPSALATTLSTPSTLNITVIGASNNHSVLECWALEPGFSESATPGISGNSVIGLGQGSGAVDFALIAEHADGGLHNAPAMQWVTFLSGSAHITLPDSEDEAWVSGGKYGTILALDTQDVSAEGHYTEYPSDEVTVAITVPIAAVPGHRVLYQGPCRDTEQDY
ncbi:hypothetical protein FE257_009257 [Aspergillus nanangensis]|uniref:Small secreted protein n=1 Tax=Aspergillus nanangensis TaxID=2582783 RepID=A0AAD4CKI2_ASPNN|nr:hypothetical protein FE257_009257 [Aspergillus nanangensis]